MNGQPEIVTKLMAYGNQAWQLALGWLTSPAAWSQLALLLVAWGLAVLAERRLVPKLRSLLQPIADSHGLLAAIVRLALRFLPMVLPLIAYGMTALGEAFTRQVFGSGAVIAFGKRLFLFFAARLFVAHVLRDPFLRLLGRYVLVPVAAVYALGLTQPIAAWLDSLTIEMGNITFSVMALLRGAVAGSLLFWLGSWSNRQSADYIKAQEELRPATRELAAKAAEVAIFGAAFLLLLQIMGINLTTIAVLGGVEEEVAASEAEPRVRDVLLVKRHDVFQGRARGVDENPKPRHAIANQPLDPLRPGRIAVQLGQGRLHLGLQPIRGGLGQALVERPARGRNYMSYRTVKQFPVLGEILNGAVTSVIGGELSATDALAAAQQVAVAQLRKDAR